MRTCPDCRKANSDYMESCHYCGASLTKPVYAGLGSSYSSKYSSPASSQTQSSMSIFLYVLGVLSLIGGFVLCAMTWKESYFIGLLCLFSGVISGVVFFAIGRILGLCVKVATVLNISVDNAFTLLLSLAIASVFGVAAYKFAKYCS